MSSDSFKKTILFEFQLGAEWEVVGGNGETQAIFNGPGKYEIIVGNDAVIGNDGHRCTVDVTDEA